MKNNFATAYNSDYTTLMLNLLEEFHILQEENRKFRAILESLDKGIISKEIGVVSMKDQEKI